MGRIIHAVSSAVCEWNYTSSIKRTDPFNEIELDVKIQHAEGDLWLVPAYWSGGQDWRVRFCPPKAGRYEVSSICTDAADNGLHAVESTLEVSGEETGSSLITHGAVRTADNRRTFEHSDGTPFFWLADTWWMALCKRLTWPDEFQILTADRVEKGFSVIQIVAGLYPDMPGFDERGANEAGFPWEEGYSCINPEYFDMADLRISWLARAGLVPCIVGCWGYYLPILGIERMKRHWRYLVARWGAYPVVWCLAGEAAMPYYLSESKEQDKSMQISGWTEIGRYVRSIDPYQRIMTIHPTQVGRDQVEDDGILDFDMLQTGHGGFESASNTVKTVAGEYAREPVMPVIVGEVSYEGIIHATNDEVQRLMFWASLLTGAAGHTYGANGIWQVNTREKPYGPSPHGATWGDRPWDEAYRLPGSEQLGLAKKLLSRYEWWKFTPRREWVDPAGSPDRVDAAFAAGIPGVVRVIYFYAPTFPWSEEGITVTLIEPDITYRAFFWNPRTGGRHDIGQVEPDADGRWRIPTQPEFQDWVLVMENPEIKGAAHV